MNATVDRDDVDRIVKQAVREQLAGRLSQAAALFEHALQVDPRHPNALTFYALLALRSDQPHAAAALATRAVAAAPQRGDAHHFLGLALHRAGRLGDAIASLERAVALRPGSFEAELDLGNALLDSGDAVAARSHIEHALALNAGSAAVYIGLGNVARAQHRMLDAAQAYARATDIDPKLAPAHNNLGNLAKESGDIQVAIAHFRHAVELAPNRADTWSNLLLALNCSDLHSREEIFDAHRAFGAHFGALIPAMPARDVAAEVAADGERRVRIGYVSSDWRRHAVAVFFEPLLAAHDREKYEIFCYYNFPVADEVTERIRTLAEHFLPVAGMSDAELATRIRNDGIDILVDMNGHTAHNRLPVFFRKPAPVQATWLGYLSTTGVPAIDYRLSDSLSDPEGLTDEVHSETLWRLPTTQWCYRPYALAPVADRAPPSDAAGITFGCLNNPSKMSATALRLWVEILQADARSRLLLLAVEHAQGPDHVHAFFARHGVAAERIELVAPRPVAQYLELYRRIDVALDPFPCVGGTTTFDALWMGVPVVSLAGDRPFARSGASILHNAGLGDLVAHDGDEYVAIACRLAGDRARLASLRSSLRQSLASSALTDAPRFARDIEAVFSAMYAGSCGGNAGGRV